jgi:hypothetical protein
MMEYSMCMIRVVVWYIYTSNVLHLFQLYTRSFQLDGYASQVLSTDIYRDDASVEDVARGLYSPILAVQLLQPEESLHMQVCKIMHHWQHMQGIDTTLIWAQHFLCLCWRFHQDLAGTDVK